MLMSQKDSDGYDSEDFENDLSNESLNIDDLVKVAVTVTVVGVGAYILYKALKK